MTPRQLHESYDDRALPTRDRRSARPHPQSARSAARDAARAVLQRYAVSGEPAPAAGKLGAIMGASLESHFATHGVPAEESCILRTLACCGTGELGYAEYVCRLCATIELIPRGCDNRHCPRCPSRLARAWLERQQSDLRDTTYFHAAFTLPHALLPTQIRPADVFVQPQCRSLDTVISPAHARLLATYFTLAKLTKRRFANDGKKPELFPTRLNEAGGQKPSKDRPQSANSCERLSTGAAHPRS